MLLVRHVVEFCEKQLLIFTLTRVPFVSRFYRRTGLPAVEGCRFEFEPEDPAEAQLFLMDSRNVMDTVLKHLEQLADLKQQDVDQMASLATYVIGVVCQHDY
ncbi:MAG: hypothetical protein EOP84_27485, partial [Verrucomicrobiaceae bacterium]